MVPSSSRPLRVFISSTYTELVDFRQEVIRAVQSLDLHIVAMEESSAKPLTKEEASIEMVQRADIMVLILSHRYGEVTALEYAWAVKRAIPILAFLPASSEAFNALDVERDPLRQQLLDALIAQVRAGQITEVYSYPKDLRLKVLQALMVELMRRKQLITEVPEPVEVGPVYDLPENLPADYVPRPEAMATLLAAIRKEDERRTVGIVAAASAVGQGGIGKTVLARALCNHPDLREQLVPDGILWATIGQHPSESTIRDIQQRWLRKLGGTPSSDLSLAECKTQIETLLQPRRMLLVFDDVWAAHDIADLRVVALRVYTLITTRNADQVADTERVDLGVMTRAESLELLTRSSQSAIAPADQEAMAERLGDLPLALSIVGALLAEGQSWADIRAQLDHGRLPLVRDARQHTVFAVVATSVQALDAETRDRFRQLAIFPGDRPLEAVAVQRLWFPDAATEDAATLARYQTRDLLALFRRRSLVQADNGLHDLVYDYLQADTAPEERQHWHRQVLSSYGPLVVKGELPDEEGQYGWRQVAWHLHQASLQQDLQALLTNATYLHGKITRLKTAAVVADCRFLPQDAVVKSLGQTLQLSAHVLDGDPAELMNQVVGRGGPSYFLHDLPERPDPHFTLLSPSLQQAGGAQLRILAGHTGSVQACAMTPDGRFALSGSYDHTLRLWNLQSGELLCQWNAEIDHLCCALSSRGGLVVAGDSSGAFHRLRIDNVDFREISPV